MCSLPRVQVIQRPFLGLSVAALKAQPVPVVFEPANIKHGLLRRSGLLFVFVDLTHFAGPFKFGRVPISLGDPRYMDHAWARKKCASRM
jgi:hypothetical protein